jgi:hypothetical protein
VERGLEKDTAFLKSLSVENDILNVTQIEAVKSVKSSQLGSILEKGNPLGGLEKLGCASMRSLMGSIGGDSVIRIWEYDESYSQILTYDYNKKNKQHPQFASKGNSINDIAIHPMGFQFAIGVNEGYLYMCVSVCVCVSLCIMYPSCMYVCLCSGGVR